MRVSLRDKRDGPHWRLWALGAGTGIVVAIAFLAWLASVMAGQSFSALLALGLIAGILILSAMGSGMLHATSRRMSLGGLARETADMDVDTGTPGRSETERARDAEDRDRRTIRAGIMLLPLLVTFIFLLAL